MCEPICFNRPCLYQITYKYYNHRSILSCVPFKDKSLIYIREGIGFLSATLCAADEIFEIGSSVKQTLIYILNQTLLSSCYQNKYRIHLLQKYS